MQHSNTVLMLPSECQKSCKQLPNAAWSQGYTSPSAGAAARGSGTWPICSGNVCGDFCAASSARKESSFLTIVNLPPSTTDRSDSGLLRVQTTLRVTAIHDGRWGVSCSIQVRAARPGRTTDGRMGAETGDGRVDRQKTGRQPKGIIFTDFEKKK